MTPTRTGWIIFIAAVGAMLGLVSHDIAELETWSQATTPLFVSSMLAHLGAVIAAFVGGKLIPTNGGK